MLGQRRGGQFALPLMALVLLQTSASLAQKAAAPAAAAAEPTLVMTASIASFDKVAGVAKEFGLGDLPFLSPGFVEEQLPFIGPGGLAPDRPAGVLLYVGPNVDLEKSLTFVLPVKDGKAELKQFAEKGAQPLAGRTDLVALEGVGFRRMRDQFAFGQIVPVLSSIREDMLTSAYPFGVDVPVARVDVDVDAFHKAAPERYDAFFNDISDTVDADDPGQRAGAAFVERYMRRVTHLGLSLHRAGAAGGGGLRLRLAVQPFELGKPAAGKVQRPGFPSGTLFRVDLAFPPATLFAGAAGDLSKTIEQQERFQSLTPQQQARVRALPPRLAKLLFDGDAGSFALQPQGTSFVGYWITHRPAVAAGALEGEMRDLIRDANDAAKLMGETKPIASFETYKTTAGNTPVNRVALLEDGKPALYVDAVQRGDSLIMSFATTDGQFVQSLVGLESEGETSNLASGWVDLTAVANLGAFAGDQPAIDAKALAEIRNVVKGKRIEWTASAQSGALQIDVNLPKSLLSELPKIVSLFQ